MVLWFLRRFRYVRELEAELDQLETELVRLDDQLKKALSGDVTLESLVAEKNECKVIVGTRMAGMMANTFYDWLEATGADNYLESHFSSADGKKVIVTVQRVNGKTPHELRREAEEKLAKLEAEKDLIKAIDTR